MKQIEITVMVNDTLENAVEKLKKQGFKIIEEKQIDDIYMSQLCDKVGKEDLQHILANTVLLRKFEENGEVIKKITYKNKTYENGQVITEEKVEFVCDELDKAEKLFNCLKFNRLVKVSYKVVVMAKDKLEIAFQDVEGLGLCIEYESEKDFEGATNAEVIAEKQKMLQELNTLGLDIGDDYDVKKAQELIKKQYELK